MRRRSWISRCWAISPGTVHNLGMHPLIFDFGEVQIGAWTLPVRLPAYGFFMLLGIVVGWLVVRALGRRVEPEAPWEDLYIGLIASGLVGAKVLYALVELPRLLSGELSWKAPLLAGGVWLGAVLGGLLFCLIFLRRHDLKPGLALNVFFTALPLSHALGRVGCYLAGCCYGAACSKPWAVTYTSDLAARFAGTPLGVPLHPSPLYEAGLEVLNFAVLLLIWRRGRPAPWTIVFTWMGLYGTQRFLLEFLRGDPRGEWLGLSTSQWLSMAMVLLAVVWFGRALRAPQAAD